MRLILSRKGFDSASGGCPSPILPGGSMLALPIPDRRSPIRYTELTWRGHNLGALVESLRGSKVAADAGAHLDPDLRADQLQRPEGWLPLLGQTVASQSHLVKNGVGPGDLFLVFGLFREVDAQLRWTGRRKHVLWGWLQVDQVLAVDALERMEASRWLSATRHPHLGREPDPRNSLYVAREGLSLGAGDLPGAGVFDEYRDDLCLTAKDASGPSTWSMPRWLLPDGRAPLTYHANPARWEPLGDRVSLRAASRGQEFVLNTELYPEARDWALGLIERNAGHDELSFP